MSKKTEPIWSGIYLDINRLIESGPEARAEIRDGSIRALIDAGFGREVKIDGTMKIEYSSVFAQLLRDDKELV